MSASSLYQDSSHGRDNKLHVWQRIEELPLSARIGGSANLPSLPMPKLSYSMDVNALNFCRFSLLQDTQESLALVAIPNLVDSSTVSIQQTGRHDYNVDSLLG